MIERAEYHAHVLVRLLVVVAIGCGGAGRSAAPPVRAERGSLQNDIDALARAHHGKVALYAKHLSTGAEIAVDADREVKTASAIKLAIAIEAAHQIKAGTIALTDRVVLREEAKVRGSGVLPFLHAGIELTLEDVLALMMIASDNTATNLAIDHVGGVGRVNARSAALGLSHTHLYKKIYVPATEAMPADQKRFGLGKSTAREMVHLLEHLHRCGIGDAALCAKIVGMMRNQQARHLIARFIETADTTEMRSAVAAKLGEVDAARVEVAIVDAKSGPILIAAFTYDNADERYSPENEGALLIAKIAEHIVRAWSPAGLRTGE